MDERSDHKYINPPNECESKDFNRRWSGTPAAIQVRFNNDFVNNNAIGKELEKFRFWIAEKKTR